MFVTGLNQKLLLEALLTDTILKCAAELGASHFQVVFAALPRDGVEGGYVHVHEVHLELSEGGQGMVQCPYSQAFQR